MVESVSVAHATRQMKDEVAKNLGSSGHASAECRQRYPQLCRCVCAKGWVRAYGEKRD